MPENKQAKAALSCPKCGETILPDDKFCFHCGRRLLPKDGTPTDLKDTAARVRRPVAQWVLAFLAVGLLAGTGFIVHRQSVIIHRLEAQSRTGRSQNPNAPPIHPVVTTTTTYPPNLPSSAKWVPEVESYQKVQISLRVPASLSTSLLASAKAWRWGQHGTPFGVGLDVVSQKPASASVNLGPQTFGTSIQKTGTSAEQAMYITWDHHQWVEVQMTVPINHIDWLYAIAKTVGVS